MPFVDASHIAAGTTLQSEIAIVGAGPAGLALALALARGGIAVTLLESGGFEIEPDSAELNAFEHAGAPLRTDRLRDRRFGGTEWYGRAVVLDPIDFEPRPWVSSDGWPLCYADVTRWYPPAAAFLGLSRPDALSPEHWAGEAVFRALDGGGITPGIHLITRHRDLARRHRRPAARAATLTTVVRATVTAIETDAGSPPRVVRLRVHAPGGGTFAVRASRYVLACGGLENARLLLVLSSERPGLFGVSAGMLGHGYINHVRAEGTGRLFLDHGHPNALALYRKLTESFDWRARSRVQFAAALGPGVQRRERLLNASAFFFPASTPRLATLREPFESLRRHVRGLRLGRSDAARVATLARAWPLLSGAAAARLRGRPYELAHLVMVDQLEQAPDTASRLVLGDGRDRFGRPRLRLEWRIGDDTRRTHRRFHELLAARLKQAGVGTLESDLLTAGGAEPEYGDNAHPMGATRMSDDPRAGVVNRNGRVHALGNLYVAGSSVFPVGGQANPTLTVVALALRLAAHLSSAEESARER